MRTIKHLALAVAALLYATVPAHADINALVTFDDLTGNQGAIGPAPYMGLNWLNFYFENGAHFNTSIDGYASGVVSQQNAAYFDAGTFGGLGFGSFHSADNTNFLFNSVYLTATASGPNPGHNTTATVVGIDNLLNAIPGDIKIVTINDDTPTLATFGWNVFGVVITPGLNNPLDSLSGFDVVIDNLSLGNTSAVPEPGAVFLFGAVGIALLPAIRRRSQDAKLQKHSSSAAREVC